MDLGAGGEQLGRALGNIAQTKPIVFAKTFGLDLFWVGFGRPLGVAQGSKNLAFSCDRCSKSDFGLDG